MDPRRIFASVPWLIGAALTFALLFSSSLFETEVSQAQVAPSPTTNRPGFLTTVKSVSPSTGILPNSIVTFTVTINTGSDLTGIVAEDIFAGRARADTTFLVGDAVLDPGTPAEQTIPGVLHVNQLNRVTYLFDLDDYLTAGVHYLVYRWQLGSASCFIASNEIHLDQPARTTGHLSGGTYTVSFPIGGAECAPTPTLTPVVAAATETPAVPPGQVGKTCNPSTARPGSTISCTVHFNLANPADVAIEDILSGLGNSSSGSPGTDLVAGSVFLDGSTTPLPASQVVRVADQLNRVVYNIRLPGLAAGGHKLTMQFTLGSNLGCWGQGNNQAHLFLNGSSAAQDTVTFRLAVRCS